jgi:hypothetical protein
MVTVQRTTTRCPCFPNAIAAVSPDIPAPTTTTLRGWRSFILVLDSDSNSRHLSLRRISTRQSHCQSPTQAPATIYASLAGLRLGDAFFFVCLFSELHLGFVYAGPCPCPSTREHDSEGIGSRLALRMGCTPTPPVHDLLRIRRQDTLGSMILQPPAASAVSTDAAALAGCRAERILFLRRVGRRAMI